MEKILPISLKLNFTPNTLGGYGLKIKIGYALSLFDIHTAGMGLTKTNLCKFLLSRIFHLSN